MYIVQGNFLVEGCTDVLIRLNVHRMVEFQVDWRVQTLGLVELPLRNRNRDNVCFLVMFKVYHISQQKGYNHMPQFNLWFPISFFTIQFPICSDNCSTNSFTCHTHHFRIEMIIVGIDNCRILWDTHQRREELIS